MNGKFGKLKLGELKAELRKRGAKVTGRKWQLVERLEFYATNDDDGGNAAISPDLLCGSDLVTDDERFWTPGSTNYKDINTTTVLPPLSPLHISVFLERYVPLQVTYCNNFNSLTKYICFLRTLSYAVADGTMGKRMYEEMYLLSARAAVEGTTTFLRGQCKAQMRKNAEYQVDIACNNVEQTIQKTHCECSVGSGSTAHCKHVCVLLWAAVDMRHNRKIVTRHTCTQQLQGFHRPKKNYFGSPIKAENLSKLKRANAEVMNFKMTTKLDTVSYKAHVRSLCLNYAASDNTTMPILQLYKPANPYAVVNDHSYAKINQGEQLLIALKLMNVKPEDLRLMERRTRKQSQTKEWFELRRHRLTSSNFFHCCNTVSSTAKNSLAKRLIDPTPFRSRYTEHGKISEPKAIRCLENIGIEVESCGLFIKDDKPYLAASPDGIVGEESLVEVKCPFNQRHMMVNEETIPFLYKDDVGKLCLLEKHPYYFQIQGQMLCSGRPFASLVVYTFKECSIISVSKNEEFIRNMEIQLEKFYEDHFKPALFHKYLYRYYDDVFLN